MGKTLTPTDVARITEMIRQESETFDQRKIQDSRWFILKLVVGYGSVACLIIVLVFSIYVLINHKLFSDNVVVAACGALFVDMLGLFGSAWKIVLSENPVTKLGPVTTLNE